MDKQSKRRPPKRPTIQGQWNAFERWQRAFLREAGKAEEMAPDWDPLSGLARFLALPCEEDPNAQDLIDRAKEKIAFFRGYFVDLSFDGAEAMARRSTLLALQMPETCESAISVWLEQDLEQEPLEAGAYFGFQGDCIRLFCNDIQDIDFGSVRGNLPFDRMLIELPGTRRWTVREADQTIRLIIDDLDFDAYYCKTKTVGKKSRCLGIDFHWE